MKWTGFGRKRPWPYRGIPQALAWKEWTLLLIFFFFVRTWGFLPVLASFPICMWSNLGSFYAWGGPRLLPFVVCVLSSYLYYLYFNLQLRDPVPDRVTECKKIHAHKLRKKELLGTNEVNIKQRSQPRFETGICRITSKSRRWTIPQFRFLHRARWNTVKPSSAILSVN